MKTNKIRMGKKRRRRRRRRKGIRRKNEALSLASDLSFITEFTTLLNSEILFAKATLLRE
jgi:hypothetical protein